MPLRATRPNVPVPPRNDGDLLRWARDLCVEMEIYFGKVDQMHIDNRGFLLNVQQPIDADGFTVKAEAPYMDLWSETGAFTSSATFAISLGVPHQFMFLSNVGGATYTIKHGAQTFLTGAADVILEPLHSIFLRWDDITGVWTQVSVS